MQNLHSLLKWNVRIQRNFLLVSINHPYKPEGMYAQSSSTWTSTGVDGHFSRCSWQVFMADPWPVTAVTATAFQNVTSLVYRTFLILSLPGKGSVFLLQPLRPSPIWAIHIETGLLAGQGKERLWNSLKTRLCITLEMPTQPLHLSTAMLPPHQRPA